MEKVRTAYSVAHMFCNYIGPDSIGTDKMDIADKMDLAYRKIGQKMIRALDSAGG